MTPWEQALDVLSHVDPETVMEVRIDACEVQITRYRRNDAGTFYVERDEHGWLTNQVATTVEIHKLSPRGDDDA